MKEKILVVGGAGYIGSHVAKHLRDSGHQVVIFDNLSTSRKENILADEEFILGDIRNFEEISQAVKGADAVIHLAALKAAGESMANPEKYALNNISGAINLLNAMSSNGVKKIVFSSSAAVYGEPKYSPIDEKHPVNPLNFYGFTKLEIEKLLEWYDRLKGIRFAALRYFNAAGHDSTGEVKGLEKNPQNLLPIVMEVLRGKRKELTVFGDDYDTPDGTCIRDYIHVQDLADAHLRALDHLENSLTVNLGAESGLSVLEIIEAVKRISGRDFPVKIGGRRPGDPPRILADSSLAFELLGWQPQHSGLENIVKTTLKAYGLEN